MTVGDLEFAQMLVRDPDGDLCAVLLSEEEGAGLVALLGQATNWPIRLVKLEGLTMVPLSELTAPAAAS